ncbi:[acyl-carrier-protein] S-malonyltransferase [Ruminiclostridium sufflavum DSM 19573]|uniref:[acyl-carrier-protein] S-malonyltransferase n=1 Tax=Ruminiclostridium sufflavum DSM 19573 TaxID=1121337 RepID=A0A318XIK4_9FIRM|nr:acyltransferase domain-containing protein [Ruminiclostridium sufflavum]PYG84950.1 [acyl-carrier-protein] S-malonyltransferase [Ruminiclostridium sufflavum DSM 19573]
MKHKVAIVFPGSGSQYVGMGKCFYDKYEVVRNTYKQASEILDKDFEKICFKGGVVKQNKIENLLPSIYVTSIAMARVLLDEYHFIPSCLAGHSLGEYSALTVSGALKFEEALNIVQLRSNLAKEVAIKQDAGMAIINGMAIKRVEEICRACSQGESYAFIACYNSEEQVLISGNNNVLDEILEQVKLEDGNFITMINSAPYHSKLLKEAAGELRGMLETCHINAPKWNVISNRVVRPFRNRDDIITHLVEQMYQPIYWGKVMQVLQTKSDMIIECGPNAVLSKIIKDCMKLDDVYSLDKEEELVKAQDLKWQLYNQMNYVGLCLKHIASSPNLCEAQNYPVEDASNMYSKVLDIDGKLADGKGGLTLDIVNQLEQIVQWVLDAKKVEPEEKFERINEIRALRKVMQLT